MARLQILELPEGSGDDRPPFVLVVDQAGEDSLFITDGPDIWPGFKNDTGCQHVIVTTETIELPANDTSGYLTPPAGKQNLVVEVNADPVTAKPRRDWCCSLAFQTLGKQHIDDCRQDSTQS